jgi:O-acetyl-ADP-ribose deacetylase (regulator of RNase III)
MDIFWANASALSLPSSQRVEVLVHDGATDLRLWPGPGADRNLLDAYGPGLREALDAQRAKHEGGSVPICEPVRVHPGKLHCNYLLWVPTRGPEENAQQAEAPSIEIIQRAVIRCLEIAANTNSVSVAFGPLGDGPNAAPAEQRLAAIVRAAHRYFEESVASGRAPRLEVVRVCDPRSGVTAAARRLVGRLAQAAPEVPAAPSSHETERAPRRTLALSGSGKARPNAATARRKAPETLEPGEVSYRRANSQPYDRGRKYSEGEWFVHAKFGVGQVKRVTPDGAIDVLFEDGSTKKMLHAQPA